MQEGIFKMLNDAYEKVNAEQFIVLESWKKTRARLQAEFPTAKIKYSYKTKSFLIEFPLPNDFVKIKDITLTPTK